MMAGCLAGLLWIGGPAMADSHAKATTVGEAVTNLVQHAQAGDTNYFNGLMSTQAPGLANQIMAMIQRSGMLTNYTQRLSSSSPTQAHLDYHYPEKGCYFQVELAKQGADWRVTGIWPCR